MQATDSSKKTATLFRRSMKLMGNRFEISVVQNDEKYANQCIDAAVSEIQRIESLLSTFKENSQTNLINQQAGISPVVVDNEVFQLISRSQRISQLTQGAFDLSYGSIDKSLWNFDANMKTLPDPATATSLVRLINYKNILLDPFNKTVFLKEKGMRIGFGGIGKGYAAEKAKQVLLSMGIQNGIVNASGDLSAWGHQPNGDPWTIGIADPNSTRNAFSYLNITNTAIATSGNYEKFIIIGGKKYSHTIDPKTGLPVQGIKSVTILSPYAELADAMATPVMIMGVKVGLDLVNQVNGLACIIVDDNNKIYTSKNINLQ